MVLLIQLRQVLKRKQHKFRKNKYIIDKMELITVSNISDKKNILQDFSPDDSLWVTSDIKSHLSIFHYLQKNKKNSIDNTSIIRVMDLWPHLLSLAYPQHSVVDRHFLTLIYHEWAKSRKKEWQKNKETGALICEYMETLAHLLQHPLRNNLIEEWIFTGTDKRKTHWTIWYDLASDFWSYLAHKKIIESSWACAFLLDQLPFKHIQFKEIIFDLELDTNKVEVELIRQIATKIKVKTLIPACFKEKDQNHISTLYSNLHQKKTSLSIQQPPVPTNSTEIKKFATPLAEIKDISHRITKALSEGIKPNKISVLAPHIEYYWTCLKSHLKRENIPVNKSERTLLYSFPVTQLWLAKMWTHLSIIKYRNLEIIYSHQNKQTNFSQLKSEFHNVTEIKKWPSNTYIKDQLKNKNELTSASTFVEWASQLLPYIKKDTVIYKAIEECLQNFTLSSHSVKGLQLKWQDWLNLLELFTKKKEIEIKAGDPEGINCLSFNALGWVDADFVYIAGLSEQNLKTDKHSVISSLEEDSITKNLGFFIKSEPADKMERTVSCFIHKEHKKLVLSFSSSDFTGTPLSASCLWLEKAMECKKDINHFDIPGASKWDQRQKQPLVKDILAHHNMTHTFLESVEQSIAEDMGQKTPQPVFKGEVKNLSASSLDNYIKCPFIFTAKKLFHLWDGPERDMDIPAIERGNFVHCLFEILQLKKDGDFSQSGILQIIKNMENSENFKKQILKIHPVIWEKEKSYLLKKALIFLEKEKIKEKLFTNYNTIACEKKYQCHWNFRTQSLSAKGDISIKGKIDRIDSNNRSYQIIDYKHSLPEGSVITSWEKAANFQLAFYVQVLEMGLADLPPLPVESALYLSYKNFNYQGLAAKKPVYIQFLGGPKKRSLISEEKKKSVLNNINKNINSLILNINEGKFHAHPRKKSQCVKCRWRKICRASHLN